MGDRKPMDNNVIEGLQNESVQNLNLSQANQLNTSSMTALILWNINKALEKNPTLDLKTALRSAQDKLEKEQGNVSAIVSQRPDERHLSCAFLAWQQLGHSHVDSLYCFVVAQMKAEAKAKEQIVSHKAEQSNKVSSEVPYEKSLITHKEPDVMFSPMSSSMSPPAMGPVLRLPPSRPNLVNPRVAMPDPSATRVTIPNPIAPRAAIPVYNVQGGGGCAGLRKTGQDIKRRIESACCLESACLEKLAAVDRGTRELRVRLSRLAKREADRIELLSRAESAWRDLEMGYIRRLRSNIEKEDEIKRKGTKTIAERMADKEACKKLIASLKPSGAAAEKTKATLQILEKEVCGSACEQLKQSELAAKEDSILCELQCRANRQDRDLQFREEAARRKKASLENELESVRGLAYEVERTMKAELKGFEAQLQLVSNELLAEDEEIEKLKKERDELATEKQEIVEDLEGCQKKCDDAMKKNLEQLKEKRNILFKLKDQTMECKCKFPIESAVQVKRTPSLAALCYCSPEDRVKKACSCMSMRSRLLTDLIVTLFEGLKFEMADCSIKMPCELLKCLEDSFNWDKGSHVKSNLRSFFAQLLCGELDIAIVNSIENYHARYVGASCADMGRPIPDLTDSNLQRWEDRALAQKARMMAETIAEQMFKERVDDIMEQAHKVVRDGPPPCKCQPPLDLNQKDTAVYQLLVDPGMMSLSLLQEHSSPVEQPLAIMPTSNNEPTAANAIPVHANRPKKKPKETKNTAKIFKEPPSSTVARTFKNDVLLLKAEIAGLKKESIKKHDLKKIEQTIKKLVQKDSSHDNQPEKSQQKNGSVHANKIDGKKSRPKSPKGKIIKKKMDPNFNTQYSVNMCFCGLHRKGSNRSRAQKSNELLVDSNAVSDDKSSGEQESQNIAERQSKTILTMNSEKYKQPDQTLCLVNQVEILKQTSPLNNQLQELERSSYVDNQLKNNNKCGSKCECFHKVPSTSSIDRLLETLMKWKNDLNEPLVLSDEVESDIIIKTSSRKCPSNTKDTSATHRQSNETNDGRKLVKSDKESNIDSPSREYSKNCSFNIKNTSATNRPSNVTNDDCELTESNIDSAPKVCSQNCPSNVNDTVANNCLSNEINYSCKLFKSDKESNIDIAPRETCVLMEAESKYMRTINLEKSNENISKCVNTIEKSMEQIDVSGSKESKKCKRSNQSKTLCRSKSKINRSTPFVPKQAESKIRRKVKSEEYKRKKSSLINQKKKQNLDICEPCEIMDNNENISSLNKSYLNKYSTTLKNEEQNTNDIDKGKPIPLILVGNTSNDQQNEHISLRSNFTLQEQLKEHTSLRSNFALQEQPKEHTSVRSNFTLQEPFINHLIDPGNLSCGSEYQVKLIGVTLDNINTDKLIKNKETKTKNVVLSPHPKQLRYKDQESEVQESSDHCMLPQFSPQKSMENYDLFENCKRNINQSELNQPPCRCKSKLNEIEHLLNIYKNKKETRDNKALDTNSLKIKTKFEFKDGYNVGSSKYDNNDENCVCCNDPSSESKELEVNTFQLLQEHIRKKLEGLKDTCQSGYCITPDEEDKVLKKLFIKIKQTVTDGTDKIACKCSEEVDSKGSWQRAYNLLQEYLKIKISRVECNCFPDKNKKETVLPELTDKVCSLIEKDFERLRDICKCKNKGKFTKTTINEEAKFQLPEKDNSNTVEINENKILKKSSILKELSSKSYIIATHNTSAQVIPNFETISCEAIKFSDPVKNTIETQSSDECQRLQRSCSIDCNVLDPAKIVTSQSTQWSKGDDKDIEYDASFEKCLKKSEHVLSKFKELAVELKRRESKSADQSLPYVGLTIDYACGQTSEQCDKNKAIAEFWATYTKSKANLKNISYLMKNTNQNLTENMNNNLNANKISTQCSIKKYDKNVNTKQARRSLTLKKSQEYLKKESCAGGTNTDDCSYSSATDNSSIEDCDAQYHDISEDDETEQYPKKKSVHFLHKSKSDVIPKFSEVYNTDCDCSKVPVCHVKMLVENIECKLANSECICDSLSSKVCPIHSKVDT